MSSIEGSPMVVVTRSVPKIVVPVKRSHSAAGRKLRSNSSVLDGMHESDQKEIERKQQLVLMRKKSAPMVSMSHAAPAARSSRSRALEREPIVIRTKSVPQKSLGLSSAAAASAAASVQVIQAIQSPKGPRGPKIIKPILLRKRDD